MNHATPASPPARPTGLAPVMLATFVNSVGTGVVTNGIYFLTAGAYRFTQTQNYLLGIALGATYILGAKATGPLLQRLRAAGVSSRSLLTAVSLMLGLLCIIPFAAVRSGSTASWPIWTLVLLYSPLTGVLWPVVEGYLSGGRSGEQLRTTMGWWNVCWSSAVVLSYWVMSPLVKSYASETILALGALHASAAALSRWGFETEPGEHPHASHEPHPPVYAHLLVTLRLLLPMAYVVSSTVGPFLPQALASLEVPERYRALLASCWLAPRVLTFFTLQRWQGWHGRWWVIVLAILLLVGGFSTVVLSPLGVGIGLSNGTCVVLLAGGLMLFGTGMATIYTGALYYGMEVGEEEIDSGGTHEALIGLGYTIGPMCGLLPSLAVDSGLLAPHRFHAIVLSTVAFLAIVTVTIVMRRIHALARPETSIP